MQSEMADVARLAAVKQLLTECEALAESSDVLNAVMAEARDLLQADHAAAEKLQKTAYKMAKLSAEEKAPHTTNPLKTQKPEGKAGFPIGWVLLTGTVMAALPVGGVLF